MSDRHEKWVRVEPGTVIPAGQPYMIERVSEFEHTATDGVRMGRHCQWFIDSTWRPPLELPTEPTWGIAIHRIFGTLDLARWQLRGDELWQGTMRSYRSHNVLDFIPLTDEQVKRIEAAR